MHRTFLLAPLALCLAASGSAKTLPTTEDTYRAGASVEIGVSDAGQVTDIRVTIYYPKMNTPGLPWDKTMLLGFFHNSSLLAMQACKLEGRQEDLDKTTCQPYQPAEVYGLAEMLGFYQILAPVAIQAALSQQPQPTTPVDPGSIL